MLGLPFDRRSHLMIEWNFFFFFGRKTSDTVASSSSVIGINYTPSVLSFGKQSNRFSGLNVGYTLPSLKLKFFYAAFLSSSIAYIQPATTMNRVSLIVLFISDIRPVCDNKTKRQTGNKQPAIGIAWNHMKYYNLSNIIGGELLTSRTCRWLPAICPHCLPTTTNLTELSLSTGCCYLSFFLIVLCVQFFEDFSEKPSNSNRVSRENTMRGLEF